MYSKKKILITGYKGDIGKILIKKFKKKELILYKNNKSRNNLRNIEKILIKIFKNNKIETVFHCATLFKGERREIENCNYYFAKILFNLSIKNNVKYFFNFDTILNKKINFYTTTKNSFFRYLRNKKKIIIFNLKISHCYSKFDKLTKFIPEIISKIKKNRNIYLTNGNQKRYFINTFHLTAAIKKIYNNRGFYYKNFNQFYFISKNQLKLRDIIEIIKKKINKNYNKIFYGKLNYRKNEVMRFSKKNMRGKIIILNSNFKKEINDIIN
jgi:CDP-paratose synthetase